MKRTLSLVIPVLLFIATIYGQETTSLTPEQKVERDTKKMQIALKLTDQQTSKLKTFNLIKTTGLEAVNADTTTTIEVKKMKRNQIQGKFQVNLKSILTPEQKEMFSKLQEENRKKNMITK